MKKLPTLHILNGDASVPAFTAAAIPGQVLVWREILSNGPAIATIPETAFWQKRQAYITASYSESEENYKEKVLRALALLREAKSFFEVVLWFDEDLVCQVNLLYLLHALNQSKPALVSVCTPAEGKNIGWLSAQEVQQEFENRYTVQPEQLVQAAALWQLYGGPDPMALQHYLQEHPILLPHLDKGLHLHLQRYPFCNSALNGPQHSLLRIISKGIHAPSEIMEQFWKEESLYGYGDSQLEQELQLLCPAFLQKNAGSYTLTPAGEAELAGKREVHEMVYWVGGVQVNTAKPNWCWNKEKGQLS